MRKLRLKEVSSLPESFYQASGSVQAKLDTILHSIKSTDYIFLLFGWMDR